ncbi:MAG: hypothetical protein R3F59_18960 [Myxococcota bacterium]
MGVLLPGRVGPARAPLAEAWPLLDALLRLDLALSLLPERPFASLRAVLPCTAGQPGWSLGPREVAPAVLAALDALPAALPTVDAVVVRDPATGAVVAGPAVAGGHVLLRRPPYSVYLPFDADGIALPEAPRPVRRLRQVADGPQTRFTDEDRGETWVAEGVLTAGLSAHVAERLQTARAPLPPDHEARVRDELRQLVDAALTHGAPLVWHAG